MVDIIIDKSVVKREYTFDVKGFFVDQEKVENLLNAGNDKLWPEDVCIEESHFEDFLKHQDNPIQSTVTVTLSCGGCTLNVVAKMDAAAEIIKRYVAESVYIPSHKNLEYRVIWEIDICAENTEDAARKAWQNMRQKNSTANVFDVIDGTGERNRIDLQELIEN